MTVPLLVRAIVAFLALPGVIGFAVPLLLAPPLPTDRSAFTWVGIALVLAGATLLLVCVRAFYVAGRGTLAPWSAPVHLVTTGPYGISRNPMYVAVTVILCGWAALFRSAGLLLYAAIVAIAFVLRVIMYEEPIQAKRFGDEWTGYRSRVRRWL